MVDAQCINLPSYLSRRSSRNLLTPDPAVFLCISMLARAVGPNIEEEIRLILDQIFALGLSLELTNALKVLAKEIPALQKDIQGTRETGQQYYNINDSINSCIHSFIMHPYRWASQNVVYGSLTPAIQTSWCS